MIKNNILALDKNNELRKIVSIGTNYSESGFSLYFFMPKNLNKLIGYEKVGSEGKSRLIENTIEFKELHLRYPKDGQVHLSFKNDKGETLKNLYCAHNPIDKLSPAKLLFSIIPENFESYPAYNKILGEFDWKIDGDIIEGFFNNCPIKLNFWVGKGTKDTIIGKKNAIANFEMKNSKQYVQVIAGQDQIYEGMHLFVAVSREKEFPNFTNLFLHSINSPVIKKVIK